MLEAQTESSFRHHFTTLKALALIFFDHGIMQRFHFSDEVPG